MDLLFAAKSFLDNCDIVSIAIEALETEMKEDSAVSRIQATLFWREGKSPDVIYDTTELEALYQKEENRWKLMELRFFEPEKKRFFNPNIAMNSEARGEKRAYQTG